MRVVVGAGRAASVRGRVVTNMDCRSLPGVFSRSPTVNRRRSVSSPRLPRRSTPRSSPSGRPVARMVPGAQDAQWTALTSVRPAGTGPRRRASRPRAQGGWERLLDLAEGHPADLLPVR